MYNETYLRILPRDPFLLFAFWEICDARADRNSQHLLRLYDVTPAHEHQYSDIPIEKTPHGGSSYIPVPEPGRRYRLAYGYRTRAGRFVPLCTSNEIATPAGRVSARAYGPGGRRADSFRADTGFLFAFSGRTMGIASPLMNDPEIPGCIVTGSSNSLRLCHETNASLT